MHIYFDSKILYKDLAASILIKVLFIIWKVRNNTYYLDDHIMYHPKWNTFESKREHY